MDDFDNITADLQQEFSMPSLLEMDLGMYLSALAFVLDNPHKFNDGDQYEEAIDSILMRAEPSLVEWHEKYQHELHEDVS